jgi:hypothetical protein
MVRQMDGIPLKYDESTQTHVKYSMRTTRTMLSSSESTALYSKLNINNTKYAHACRSAYMRNLSSPYKREKKEVIL